MHITLADKNSAKLPTKKDLLRIREDFVQFNQARLLRIRSFLLTEQQNFLSLLPLNISPK